MHSTKFHSYHELINHAGKSCDQVKPDIEWLLEHLGFKGLTLHAHAPLVYIVDYSRNKYLYINPSCKKVLDSGIDHKEKSGIFFPTGLCHKNDLKIYNEKIICGELAFLNKQPLNKYCDLSFSFNYRIATEKDQWRTVLQRTTYLKISNDAEPLAAVIYITDISQFKEDSRIIHTVEEIDHHNETSKINLLQKSVYYPDKETQILSRREVEILKLVYSGLSSKRIADELYISVNTINNHRKNMLTKTHTKNTYELLGYAIKNGFLEGA